MTIWPVRFSHFPFDDRASLEVHKYTVNVSLAPSTLSEPSPVIASLEANSRTDGGVIHWAAFAQLGGGPGKICAKAARFNDRDFDAERSDLFEQRFGE
jgi:hypothetical protein